MRTKSTQPPDAWGELSVWKEWKEVDMVAWPNTRYKERHAFWKLPESITVYSQDWKEEHVIPLGWLHLRPSAQVSAGILDPKYGTGGHNWYMTTRFNVTVHHPDGYVYSGFLITGGYNATFRLRRTKQKWVALPVIGDTRRVTIKQNPRSKMWVVRDRKGKRVHVAKMIHGKLIHADTARNLMPTYVHQETERLFAA